jgi:hypothetical protein
MKTWKLAVGASVKFHPGELLDSKTETIEAGTLTSGFVANNECGARGLVGLLDASQPLAVTVTYVRPGGNRVNVAGHDHLANPIAALNVRVYHDRVGAQHPEGEPYAVWGSAE